MVPLATTSVVTVPIRAVVPAVAVEVLPHRDGVKVAPVEHTAMTAVAVSGTLCRQAVAVGVVVGMVRMPSTADRVPLGVMVVQAPRAITGHWQPQ